MNKEEILKKYFGYDEFREGQGDVIESILSGKDTVAILPTGAGKSICFQVPALMQEGLTIVVSPLISLMHDQVAHLQEKGIPAVCVDSSMGNNTYGKSLYDTINGKYKILYTSPERLSNRLFVKFAKKNNISMLIVDEAHCVSQWGHDFRPHYGNIPKFLEQLPRKPLYAAFTATATPFVRQDMVNSLHMENPRFIVRSFDRPNLNLGVRYSKRKNRALISALESHVGQSGVIYCATRKLVEDVTRFLKEHGYRALRYHAGLSPAERKANQEAFLAGEVKVVVATNAFGMGIDKSDVAFVIHYNMPSSLEGYYQEAGRAGRDGEKAYCLILYSHADKNIHQLLLKDNLPKLRLLEAMWDYCNTHQCLREYILNYFGENQPHVNCENCSNCLEKSHWQLFKEMFYMQGIKNI